MGVDDDFLKAAYVGDLAATQRHVKQGANLAAHDPKKYTALISASRTGKLDVVKYLVQAGCDVQAAGSDGNTALTWAAYNGRTDICRVLVEAGADRQAKTQRGETALDLAKRGSGKNERELLDVLSPNYSVEPVKKRPEPPAKGGAAAAGAGPKSPSGPSTSAQSPVKPSPPAKGAPPAPRPAPSPAPASPKKPPSPRPKPAVPATVPAPGAKPKPKTTTPPAAAAVAAAAPHGPVFEKGRGLAIVIGEDRPGAARDLEMIGLVGHMLGCEVKTLSDLHGKNVTADGIRAFVQDQAGWLRGGGFICLFVASHGDWQSICGAQHTVLKVADLLTLIDIKSDVAKLVFINKCRGHDRARLMADGPEDTDAAPVGVRHEGTNFYVAYSTSPGTVSYRDEKSGSLWLQAFFEAAKQAHGQTVLELMADIRMHAVLRKAQCPQGPRDDVSLVKPWVSAVFGKHALPAYDPFPPGFKG